MDLRQEKRRIRRAVIARILAMASEERTRQELALVAAFPGLPGFETARTVLLYASAFPEEFDTRPMLKIAREAGKIVACPTVDRGSNSLRLHRIDDPDRDLRPGTLGIPEPASSRASIPVDSIDWVLVPGVAYDVHRNRIGRGAGHYDRLLPRLRHDVLRIALAFDEQWVDELPAEPHDVPLDGVVSPGRPLGLADQRTSTFGGSA